VYVKTSVRRYVGIGQRLRTENRLAKAIWHICTATAKVSGAIYASLPIGIESLPSKDMHLPKVGWGECTPAVKVFHSIMYPLTSG